MTGCGNCNTDRHQRQVLENNFTFLLSLLENAMLVDKIKELKICTDANWII